MNLRATASARPARVRLVVAAFLSAAGVASAEPRQLEFATGPPELIEPADPASAGRERLLTREEYDAFAAKHSGEWFVAIRKVPESLSAHAGFGVNLVIAGKNRGFAVDGDVKKGYVLYADLNGNGDLTDDTPIPLEHPDGYYAALLKTSVTETHEGESVTYPVQIRLLFVRVPTPSGWQMAYRVEHETVRRGTIRIGDRQSAFALFGVSGLYDKPGSSLWIDLDGDGRELEDEDAVERFRPGDRFVKLGGAGYELHVDPYGRSLALTPSERPIPDRPSLMPGTPAPEFALTDVDGATHRLADYHGKVLLIDAWEPWCDPCRVEAPGLAALYGRYRDRGLAILGLTSASAGAVAEFARELDQRWPHASEPLEGPVHALFRIHAFPTHILIDRTGRIVMARHGGLEMKAFETLVEATLGPSAKGEAEAGARSGPPK